MKYCTIPAAFRHSDRPNLTHQSEREIIQFIYEPLACIMHKLFITSQHIT